MNTLTAAPYGYASAAYPVIGTAINGLNTVYFSPEAGLKQGTTLSGVKNFYWVGRISSSGSGAVANYYFMLGHDSTYYWCGNSYGSLYLNNTYAPTSIGNAPASHYTSDASAVVNSYFGAVSMPSNGNTAFLSVSGISDPSSYQGLCYDRVGVHCGWCGDLAEVLIFSTALTKSQHMQVEGYLAWKWGLQNNLPSTHPFKKIKP
jgi:hypothetical protein